MTRADELGTSTAFGKASSARSSRRDEIDKAINGDATNAPTDLPVTKISENPDNPRNHLRNLDDMVETVREVGVIMPIVVATVDAYLRARADRTDDLDAGSLYVVVDGHRRLEAARTVGLATIPVRVDDARVATDEALLETAFVANYHREDMTDIEEATALQQLVNFYKSQTKAAKRLGIPQGTLSAKLSLLKLSPELQADLLTGERKVEHVRNLGKLAPAEQKQKADQRAKDAVARKAAVRPPALDDVQPAAAPAPADYHGVIIPNPDQPTASATPAQREAPAEEQQPQHSKAAEPPAPSQRAEPQGMLPSRDPEELADLVNSQLERRSRMRLIALLLQYNEATAPEDESALV